MRRAAAVLLGLLVSVVSGGEARAGVPWVVCIGTGGSLVVRETKCVAGESRASLTNLPQRGAKGATGPAGAPGIRGRRIESLSDIQFVRLNSSSYTFAHCDRDEVVIGGGCACGEGFFCNSAIATMSPLPLDTTSQARQGWRCDIAPTVDPDAAEYTSYVICADAG